MAYLNKIQLIGNVGNVQIREYNGKEWANVSLATTRRFKNNSGEDVKETDWHALVINGNSVEVVKKYVSKGDPLYVEGELRSRKYTGQDGKEQTVWEVRVISLQLLKPREQSAPVQNQQYVPQRPAAPQQSRQDNYGDDLPF